MHLAGRGSETDTGQASELDIRAKLDNTRRVRNSARCEATILYHASVPVWRAAERTRGAAEHRVIPCIGRLAL